MEEVKHEEDELNEDKHSFLRQYKKLKTEHEMLRVENDGHSKNTHLLNKLHEDGVIDAKGQPLSLRKKDTHQQWWTRNEDKEEFHVMVPKEETEWVKEVITGGRVHTVIWKMPIGSLYALSVILRL